MVKSIDESLKTNYAFMFNTKADLEQEINKHHKQYMQKFVKVTEEIGAETTKFKM